MTNLYKIIPGYNGFTQINPAQRMSSLFSEAPAIAGKVLRRGTSLVLTEVQYLANKSKISMLEKAGAIKVELLVDGGKIEGSVTVDVNAPLAPTLPEVAVDLAKPIAPSEVIKEATDLAVEVASDVVKAVAPELSEKPRKRGK